MKKLRSRESNRLSFSLSVLSLSYSLARFALLRNRAQEEQLKANYWRGKYYISLSLSLSMFFFVFLFLVVFFRLSSQLLQRRRLARVCRAQVQPEVVRG